MINGHPTDLRRMAGAAILNLTLPWRQQSE